MKRFTTVIVTIMAVLLSTFAFPGTISQEHEKVKKTPKRNSYVALGSSYAAGLENPVTDTDGCMRSKDSYPVIVARKLGYTLIDKTCSGATTDDVITRDERKELEPQISELSEDVKLVTLTIGSNDVKYMGRIKNAYCNNPECFRKPLTKPDFYRLSDSIRGIIRVIKSKSKNARILFIGYPKPISDKCIPDNHRESLDTFYTNMIEAMKIGSYGADYVTPFQGHELCSKNPWFIPKGNQGAFHPNKAGRQALADIVIKNLKIG